jgi:hypothetical protein
MTTAKPAPCHATFNHKVQQWDVTVSLWCGVYRAIIECESIEVEKRVVAPTKEANKVVADIIIELFGAEYGLG